LLAWPSAHPRKVKILTYRPILEGFCSYFGIAYEAPTRARFATDSIASTILE
jgi:hypothetical protein